MKLFVHFDGLLGFVPSPTRDSMTVILVNGLQSNSHSSSLQSSASHSEHRHSSAHEASHGCVPPHYPYISFLKETLVSPEKAQDLMFGNHEASFWASFFRWEDLCVVRDKQPCNGLHIKSGRRPGTAEPQFDGDEFDFSWLVEMSKIDPDLGEIDPGCLLPDPPRNRVIGRVRLDSGYILSDEIAGPSSNKNFLWEFKAVDGSVTSPLCQALASRVVWATEFEGPTVTLRLTRFGSGRFSDICLKPADGLDWVQVNVGNLPLDGMLGVDSAYTLEESLSHFSLLSKLAKNNSCRTYVPSLVKELARGGDEDDDEGTVRGGTTACIGGTFSG